MDLAYSKVQQFIDQFERKFGEKNCTALLGCDLRIKEGQKTYLTKNLFEKCKTYVEETTRMVVSMIDEKPGM